MLKMNFKRQSISNIFLFNCDFTNVVPFRRTAMRKRSKTVDTITSQKSKMIKAERLMVKSVNGTVQKAAGEFVQKERGVTAGDTNSYQLED